MGNIGVGPGTVDAGKFVSRLSTWTYTLLQRAFYRVALLKLKAFDGGGSLARGMI